MAPLFVLLVLLFGAMFDTTQSEAAFEQTAFDIHPEKKLNLTRSDKAQSFQVSNKMECFTKCTMVHWCQSGNFKTTPGNNGLHVCELLPSDRFTKGNTLKKDKAYLHFNIKTPCHVKIKPCLNEGKCVFKNNKHQCECKNGWSGEQCEKAPKTCREIHQYQPSSASGVYSIYPTNPAQAIKVYCDMDSAGGGWTLVYSYTFTKYSDFGAAGNAVTPRPTWPMFHSFGASPASTTPPLSETNYNAMDFNLWKTIGNEVFIKSNINNWIQCQEGNESLVNWRQGTVTCHVVKNVSPTCQNYAPDSFTIFDSPAFLKSSDAAKVFYYFESRTFYFLPAWPVHDPCGASGRNHIHGISNPHGNIYIR